MTQPILLDTCAVLFMLSRQLKPSALEMLEDAGENDTTVYISPITAWEIGILVSRGRLMLTTSPDLWFTALVQDGIRLAQIGPDVLIASSFLPSSPLRDPADCIIAATARTYGYRLMTRDKPLLDYASQGHLNAIPC